MGDRLLDDQRGFAQDLGARQRQGGAHHYRRRAGAGQSDFAATGGAQPHIWSYGHRNPQGAALHPATGELWASEHGPQGGDEVNLTLPGRNYGWPVISYGQEYGTLTQVGEGTAKAGMEQPLTLLGKDRWLGLDAGHAEVVDRAQRHGLLHRRRAAGLEGQPVRRRAGRHRAVAAHARRQHGGRRANGCWPIAANASATCGRGRTAGSTC